MLGIIQISREIAVFQIFMERGKLLAFTLVGIGIDYLNFYLSEVRPVIIKVGFACLDEYAVSCKNVRDILNTSNVCGISAE